MTILNRRNFLTLTSALICAPAIVRASSLMPVKVYETFGPGGLLTPDILLAQMIKEYETAMKWEIGFPTRGQLNINLHLTSVDKRLSLEEATQRFIKPAALELAGVTPGGSSYEDLTLPKGMMTAISQRGKFASMRMLEAYDIGRDEIITRFDILATP